MKTQLSTILLLLFFGNGFSQAHIYQSYDFKLKSLDTLLEIQYDTTIVHDKSSNYIGDFSSVSTSLPNTLPTTNVYPESHWTRKAKATDFFELSDYPIRTLTEGFVQINDTLKNSCSGVMISERHVLTSAHCYLSTGFTDKEDIKFDSILICPGYNNGEVSQVAGCSYVKKAYFPMNWEYSTKDIIVLELENPLGQETGWMSIGFHKESAFFLERIFHKLSYPAVHLPFIDTTDYNGDTMYYSYGGIDLIGEYHLGIQNTSAIPGESGSSIFHVDEEGIPTSFGILNFSNNMTHVRNTAQNFYAILEIIRKDLVKTKVDNKVTCSIYPNPASERVIVESDEKILYINMYDVSGKLVMSGTEKSMDIGSYGSGTYFLQIRTEGGDVVKKLIKR